MFVCRELGLSCPKSKSGIITKLLNPIGRNIGISKLKFFFL